MKYHNDYLIIYAFLSSICFTFHKSKINTNAFVTVPQTIISSSSRNLIPHKRFQKQLQNNIHDIMEKMDTNHKNKLNAKYTYDNVKWKLKPWLTYTNNQKSTGSKRLLPPIFSPRAIYTRMNDIMERGMLKVASNLIRFDCKLKGQTPPKVLCPKSGKAVLEAYVKQDQGIHAILPFKKKVARFGITTHRGPPAPQITSTIKDIYNVTILGEEPGVAAIIYMFIEPEYRSTGLGEMALEIISSIQALQRCDFTILVADDDGSGKLIDWYTQNGFQKAPLIQDLMGSPGGIHGITMIRPTVVSNDVYHNCTIEWW